MVVATLGKNLLLPVPKWSNCDFFAFKKTKSCRQHALSAMVDFGGLSAFVNKWQGKIGERSKIIFNRTLHETLRHSRNYYTNVAVGN